MRLKNIRNKHTHHAFNGISRAYSLQYSKGAAVVNELFVTVYSINTGSINESNM